MKIVRKTTVRPRKKRLVRTPCISSCLSSFACKQLAISKFPQTKTPWWLYTRLHSSWLEPLAPQLESIKTTVGPRKTIREPVLWKWRLQGRPRSCQGRKFQASCHLSHPACAVLPANPKVPRERHGECMTSRPAEPTKGETHYQQAETHIKWSLYILVIEWKEQK